jgi:hypothetical protein
MARLSLTLFNLFNHLIPAKMNITYSKRHFRKASLGREENLLVPPHRVN